jgi:hypothetical protein
MSYLKSLTSNDVIVTPFKVNKSFTFKGSSSLIEPDVEIDRFLGKNLTGLFSLDTGSEPITGYIFPQYQRLIYTSVKELYYSNYISSSLLASGSYENYLQTTLNFERYFPTASDSTIAVFSIPSKLYGEYIHPTSFYISAESGSVGDDGEGNLINLSDGEICGNIIYNQGIAIITNDGTPENDNEGVGVYGVGIYGESTYGANPPSFILNFISSSQITCSFNSSYNIYETQYKCTIRANEYNGSLNPSLLKSGSTNTYKDFVTGSDFSPYVTTIGLYNENQELIAVAKLAQPLPTSQTTDTTILINIDR